jgi:hypothetical protein
MAKVPVDEEIEDLEYSIALTGDFLEKSILPVLDKFENENSDTQYVSGIATHGLFAELIFRMLEMGYTEKELKQEIKMCVGISKVVSHSQTLH